MSTFASLQYKSAGTTSSVRQPAPLSRRSPGNELPKATPISELGVASDQQHAPNFSIAHIPIDPPDQAPRNTFEEHRENHTGLPDKLKAGIERLSGMSMDDVKVYYNSPKPAELGALAYTQGTDIHVGPGQEQHLPHEAWHVVQQRQERVKPTLQAKGVAINDATGLEREADVMGKRVNAVQVHPNAKADSLSHSVDSEAFTTGTNIFFRSGMFNTSTSQGMQLLAHEATHVVQKASGLVASTPDSISISNSSDRFEQAAEAGEKNPRNSKRKKLITKDLTRKLQQVDAANTSATHQNGVALKSKSTINIVQNNRASYGLNSQVIQRLKGPISKKAKGLSRKEIQAMIKEAETTYFDMRGHSKKRHGGKVSDEEKMARKIPLATSFGSDDLLTLTIEKAVADNIGIINGWLKQKTDENLVLKVDMSRSLPEGTESLGTGMEKITGIGPRFNKKEVLTNATVIFRKVLPDTITKSMNLAEATEWHLLTAFPSE